MQWDPDYTHRAGSEKHSNATCKIPAQGNPIHVLKFQRRLGNQQYAHHSAAFKIFEPEVISGRTELSEQNCEKTDISDPDGANSLLDNYFSGLKDTWESQAFES